jgi:hypothetical protein
MKIFIATMAVALMGSVSAWAGQTETASHEALQVLARDARTAADHADVARQFRQRAERLTVTADQIEARAREHRQTTSQLDAKWPASGMSDRHVANLRNEATSARQDAHDARVAATRHYGLAIEQAFMTAAN